MTRSLENSRYRTRQGAQSARGSRGFTLTELMVSILIGLFIMAGVLTLIQSMKRATGLQSNLSQLQDNERFATNLINDVVQSAGNFPTAANGVQATSFFPAVNVAVQGIPTAGLSIPFSLGQIIAGLDTGSAQGAVIAIRYATSGSDNLVGCDGNPSTAPVTWINIFSIDSNNNVQCQLYTMDSTSGALLKPSTTTTLVNGVTSLTINYGLTTNISAGFSTPDVYLSATQVLALPAGDVPPLCCGITDNFANTKTVQMTLQFTNPLAGQPSQPATVKVVRVFQVMTQAT
jgi:type IV pilus assembly protein PilW